MLIQGDIEVIEDNYSFKVELISKLPVSSWNTLYYIKTNRGKFCLKVLNRRKNWDAEIVPDENFRFIYNISKLFDNSKLYKVLLPILTKHGTCWAQNGNRFFLLFDWINNARTLTTNSSEEIKLGGIILSKIHQNSSCFGIKTPQPRSIIQWDILKWISNYSVIKSNVEKKSKQLLSNSKASLITNWFERECGVISNSKAKIEKLLLEKKRGLIHGAFTPRNILISENELYLIDFDTCQQNFYISEFAYALLEFSGGKHLYGSFDTQKAAVFIKSYISKRELSGIEIDVLPIFLKFLILRAVSYAYKRDQFEKRHRAYKELREFSEEVLRCFN